MRIFVVNEVCDNAEIQSRLLQSDLVVVQEYEHFDKALADVQALTEDKISVIIVNTVKEEQSEEHLLKVQTFGNFEVFYRGVPIFFGRSKAKELLAYLIDRRGATVTTAEACAVLWEDKEYNFSLQRQFQTIVSDLMKSLKRHKCDHFIRRRRNCLSIDVAGLDCDFYKLMAGDKLIAKQYNGEYMSNYSWAETTAGFLCRFL